MKSRAPLMLLILMLPSCQPERFNIKGRKLEVTQFFKFILQGVVGLANRCRAVQAAQDPCAELPTY